MDWQHSKIQTMSELPNHYFGGVTGKYENATYLAFLVRNNKIELSDLRINGTVYDFVYDMDSRTYSGKGTVNHFRECEMFVYFVLLLLESHLND
jgi:hypothetical protein